MNYKQAAGRNWTRAARKSSPVKLHQMPAGASALGRSPVWYAATDLKNAPGRNWNLETRRARRVRLRQATEAGSHWSAYPLRERGGGDHDQPYEYRTPSSRWSFPFTSREYARLLILRSRLSEERG